MGGFWDAQKWLAGDFNGDGKCDIVNIFNDAGMADISVHLSDGTKFLGDSYWGSRQGGFWDQQIWRAGDFNGDGKCDVVCIYDNQGQADLAVHLSNGTSFTGITYFGSKLGAFVADQQWIVGDFNGDGRSDLASISAQANGQCTVNVYASNGAAFLLTHNASAQGVYETTQKWFGGKFNLDNLSDIGKIRNTTGNATIDVHVSVVPPGKG